MPLSSALLQQKLCVDFASVKLACPKGIYVAPVPDEPLLWTGVLFVRRGPYANAVLRFQIDFPPDFPHRPPFVVFQSDVFHPLVTPLTTYTYSTTDFGTDTVSAADEQRLPPGGLSLRHGFPEWFEPIGDGGRSKDRTTRESKSESVQEDEEEETVKHKARGSPHIVEVLQYLRIVFDTDSVLDSVPLEAAANSGAWHAWKTYRARSPTVRAASLAPLPGTSSPNKNERSPSPRQQPGGARRPGEWNWKGVWEDRVRKSVQASLSEPVLFGGSSSDVIGFLKIDREQLGQIDPFQHGGAVT